MAVIDIFNIVIDTKVIVGIGPLMRIQRNDIHAQAYKELSFKFDLYTLYYTITVDTGPLSFDGMAEKLSGQQYNRIHKEWKQLRDNMTAGCDLAKGFNTDKKFPKGTPPGKGEE